MCSNRPDPKSDAGRRTVNLPAFVVSELRAHLVTFVPPDGDAPCSGSGAGSLVVATDRVSGQGLGPLRGFRTECTRRPVPHRATLAAQSGGTTKELMARLGHSTPKAALIYQHAVEERDYSIALALDEIGRWASEGGPARDGRAMDR
ncbi:MAG: hypothetical protein J2P58_12635 [Acidimicrobiaceae bacterium]|nr:hypothetical protein [Acidimicrobiaceae bacterium]